MEKALEEIAAGAFEAEELGQLGGGDVKGRPRLEARHDRIGEEVGEVGQAKETAADGDHADQEGDGSRQRGRRAGSPAPRAAMPAATASARAEVGPTASWRLVPNTA